MESRYSHSESLHLATAQRRRRRRLHAPGTPHRAVVDVASEECFRSFRKPSVVVADRPVEVRIKSLRELFDERLRATETCREPYMVVVARSRGVSQGYVVAYLYQSRVSLREGRGDGSSQAALARTDSGKCVKSWKRTEVAWRRSYSLRVRTSCPPMKISPSSGSYNRTMSLRIVLFPEPLTPTMTCPQSNHREYSE